MIAKLHRYSLLLSEINLEIHIEIQTPECQDQIYQRRMVEWTKSKCSNPDLQ